jgi:hypothetical protein
LKFNFDPSSVRRIRINEPYEYGVIAGDRIIIQTPGAGWSVTRRFWTKTVRIKAPGVSSGRARQRVRASDGYVNQSARVSGGGTIYQAAGNQYFGPGRALYSPQGPVLILLPKGVVQPETISL